MSTSEIRHQHGDVQATLTSGVIRPLMPSNTGVGHTHPDVEFLNSLNMDPQQRLRTGIAPINPPLKQSDW